MSGSGSEECWWAGRLRWEVFRTMGYHPRAAPGYYWQGRLARRGLIGQLSRSRHGSNCQDQLLHRHQYYHRLPLYYIHKLLHHHPHLHLLPTLLPSPPPPHLLHADTSSSFFFLQYYLQDGYYSSAGQVASLLSSLCRMCRQRQVGIVGLKEEAVVAAKGVPAHAALAAPAVVQQ